MQDRERRVEERLSEIRVEQRTRERESRVEIEREGRV